MLNMYLIFVVVGVWFVERLKRILRYLAYRLDLMGLPA